MRFFLRSVFLALAFALAFSSGGCTVLKKLHRHKKTPAATPAPTGPQLVGTITLVNSETHFVLIDVGFSSVPRVGTALKAMRGSVETGVVTVGEVRKRPFAIADIVQGDPRSGDQVFQ